MDHQFTSTIKGVLAEQFGEDCEQVYYKSLLIQYLNEKTRSANKGSKSRSSFANLYAIYVIVEDYIKKGYDVTGDYSSYEGAPFMQLFTRQRELPFGSKLQNHALNNRMNSEFQKFFKESKFIPILRDLATNRYWINDNLIKIKIHKKEVNIAKAVLTIIDEYIKTKQDLLHRFIETCRELSKIGAEDSKKIEDFILGLVAPNQDARLFEIVSYAILKYFYHDKTIIWGFDMDKLTTENLKLYKTGRTNANDGGIDFVMKPLGTFFQVTETIDFKKYFLDIEKIQRYPITFVIKSEESVAALRAKIQANALKSYSISSIVNGYMACIEEIINIPVLRACFDAASKTYLTEILNEIILQSKVEFNIDNDEDEDEEEEDLILDLK